MDRTKLLKKSKYFKDLESLEFFALLRCLQGVVREYKKNEFIVMDGDECNSLYIIIQGYARTYKLDQYSNRYLNDEFPVDSIFGLEYHLTGKKYFNEFLVATEDTVILICNNLRFITLCQNKCKRHIDFIKYVFEDLARKDMERKRRISYFQINKTKDKVMAYLKYVKSTTRKTYFTIPFNRQELADYLGVDRSALSIELSKLKKDNIIDYDKNSFKILKKD